MHSLDSVGSPVHSSPSHFYTTQALFSFLEGDVTNQLRRVYPVRPARADAWLGGEIGRAARDPGALGVFRSVFYLPKPRALNYLVAERFGGPTLVLQVWRASGPTPVWGRSRHSVPACLPVFFHRNVHPASSAHRQPCPPATRPRP